MSEVRFDARPVLGAMLLILAACGGAGTPKAPVPPPTPGVTTLDKTGGTARSADGRLALEVPAGALLGPTTITVTPGGELGTLDPAVTLVPGTTYGIGWSGAGFDPGTTNTIRISTNAGTSALVSQQQAPSEPPPPPGSGFALLCGPDGSVAFYVPAAVASQYVLYFGYSIGKCTQKPSGGPQVVVAVVTSPLPMVSGPGDRSVHLHDSAVLGVTASGARPLTYQWRHDDKDIDGATGPTYDIPDVQPNDAGRYTVKVSNVFGTATSAGGTLSIIPATWSSPQPVSPDYSAFVAAPKVGIFGGKTPFVAWVDPLARTLKLSVLPPTAATLGTPIPVTGVFDVVSGPDTLTAYVVFIDGNGTASCGAGYGNRLSAVALGAGIEQGAPPPSNRFTLYESTACFGGFSASRTSNGLTFVLQDPVTNALVSGDVFVRWDGSTWLYPAGPPTVHPIEHVGDCAGATAYPVSAGYQQAFAPASTLPATEAVLAFQALSTKKLCVARYRLGSWDPAVSVLASPSAPSPFICNDGTAVVVGGSGRALVVCSLANATAFDLVALELPAGSTAWTPPMTLDTGMADSVLPAAAINGDGDAYVVWRRHAASADPTVVQAARLAQGTWTQKAVSERAVDTRFPRVSVPRSGDATIVFSAKDADGKFRPHASVYHVGSARWDDAPTEMVDPATAGESQFATPLTYSLGTSLLGAPTVWNETDRVDATKRRVVTVQRTQ